MFYDDRSEQQKLYPKVQITRLPARLVLFRDGVSDGELLHVVQEEWDKLKCLWYFSS